MARIDAEEGALPQVVKKKAAAPDLPGIVVRPPEEDDPDAPIVDENFPGLGRHARYLRLNRAAGGLSDDPAEGNPVRNPSPIGKTR